MIYDIIKLTKRITSAKVPRKLYENVTSLNNVFLVNQKNESLFRMDTENNNKSIDFNRYSSFTQAIKFLSLRKLVS